MKSRDFGNYIVRKGDCGGKGGFVVVNVYSCSNTRFQVSKNEATQSKQSFRSPAQPVIPPAAASPSPFPARPQRAER